MPSEDAHTVLTRQMTTPYHTKHTQRFLAINVAYFVTIFGMLFAAIYMLQFDGPGWRFSVLSNLAAVAALVLGSISAWRNVVWRTLLFAVVFFFYILNELAYGTSFRLHLALLATPAIYFYFLGSSMWWLILAFTVISGTTFMLAELYFPWDVGWDRTGYVLAFENFRTSTLDAHDFMFFTNIVTMQLAVYLIAFSGFRALERAERALAVEHARSESLLHNLLPEEIASRLKLEPDKTIADSLPQVAILFADIVDFTPRAAKMKPEAIVEFLNDIFSSFDQLAEKHGLEKIKTIGDAYMVAAGMPRPCGDPLHRVAEMSLDMLHVTQGFPDGVKLRIGLHAGPAVAGVIGNRKLFYDVWGETVNTASRMESHGEPGRIQVTETAKTELEGDYAFALRGIVNVKGVGQVETWWLTGRNTTG